MNTVIRGRGGMFDLGLGSVFKHLERHLGLFLANIVAACLTGIAVIFLIKLEACNKETYG